MYKTLFFVSAFLLMLSSCNGEKKQQLLSESSGNLNNLSVVLSNDMWQGKVGEAIRATMAAPVDGLPQEEPLFHLSQIPPQVFSGFVTKNRTVLKIEIVANIFYNIFCSVSCI